VEEPVESLIQNSVLDNGNAVLDCPEAFFDSAAGRHLAKTK
jgi:hypothetical protein